MPEVDDVIILVVSGSRLGHPWVERTLNRWYAGMCSKRRALKFDFILYVGDATGVDAQATHWAVAHGGKVRVFKADWKKYGPSAGPIRNQEMTDAATEAVSDLDAYVEGYFFPSVQGKGTQECHYRFVRAGHLATMVEVREKCL